MGKPVPISIILCCWLLLALGLPALAQPMDDPLEETWLDVTVNEQVTRSTVLALLRPDGEVLVRGEDLTQWRLRLPDATPLLHFDEDYYPLSALDGLDYTVNPRRLTLELRAPATLFTATRLADAGRADIEPIRSSFGAFFNFDLSATHADRDTTASGLFEAGVFNGWGSGTTSFVAREPASGGDDAVARLDTTWRWDDPDNMRTLRIGDTFTRGTDWSGAVRFGGLQWGTNFAIRPGFVTLPLLTLGGEAGLPSTVDLYINDALRLRREVPPGPFSIDEIPVVTGRGEARLVVRDILGREQVITQDYFSSTRLLRKGLHDYSYELGFVRENYGRESNDYGRAVAATTHRYGVSDRFTAEFHGQFLADQQTVGLGGAWLPPLGGVLHAAAATSRRDDASGHLLSVGYRNSGRVLSFGIDSQFASEDFVRLGMSGEPLPSQQHRAFASIGGFGAGSLSLSYTKQDHRTRDDVEFVTARYSRRLGRYGRLGLSALYFPEDGETRLGAHFSMPLGAPRTSAGVSASSRSGGGDAALQVQRSLPAGRGYGYRLRAGAGDRNQLQGSVAYQNDYGTYQLEGSHTDGRTGVRANLGGGLAALGGGVFPTRRINDSFAVVQVPGFADVRVYAENQEVARTDRHGNALVPRLRSYERNRIRIEQADLPLGINIGRLEREISPYYRSGVVVDFPVERSRDAFFRILLDDGEALPTGAVVVLENGERFPVGLRGEVFLMGLEPVNRLRVLWRQQSCEIDLNVPDSDEPILDLGSHTCSGVHP